MNAREEFYSAMNATFAEMIGENLLTAELANQIMFGHLTVEEAEAIHAHDELENAYEEYIERESFYEYY